MKPETPSPENFIRQKLKWLTVPVDPYILSAFRIIYGLFMAYEIIYYHQIGLIRNMFFLPAINFKYDFLHWLKPLPELWMNAILVILFLCALLIATGIFFKWACRIFALGFAYIFLLDKSIYNNHLYLFILLAILLSFTDADRWLSFRKKTPGKPGIPRWQIFILQFQIIIVYFYGGLAKLTHDWLVNQQPMRTLVDSLSSDFWMSPILKNEFGVYLLAYGGIIIDLVAPFVLWYKPLRKWALIPFILFHFSNAIIFSDIGIFPFVMTASLILFFDTKEIPVFRNLFKKGKHVSGFKLSNVTTPIHSVSSNNFAYSFLGLYFIFQLLFPFRGHFLPNPMDWTTIGNRFSWRMKVDTRELEEMEFTVINSVNDQVSPVDLRTLVNDMQILNMSMDPRSIADFGVRLKDIAMQIGIEQPVVKARIRVKYNGRQSQFFINPNVDISSIHYSPFKKFDWLVPVNN